MSGKRYFVPVDFSAASRCAANLAAVLVQRTGGELVLAHVDAIPGATILSVEPIVIPPALWERVVGDARGASEEKLTEWTKDLSVRAGRGTVRSEVLSGGAVDSILEGAVGCDLIVMGSHGAGGAERFFFGSVAESVSRAAPCPVLVTRERESTSDGFKRVVVGVDLSENCGRLIEAAATWVDDEGVVELVHVMQLPTFDVLGAAMGGSTTEWDTAVEHARKSAVEAMNDLVEQTADAPFRCTATVELGRVEEELLEKSEGADLVVVGAHARVDLKERIIGTTADRVLRHSEIPVLLIPGSE